MAVKCNIAKQALEKYKLDVWGFAKDVKVDKSILLNYAEYLACESITLNYCGENDSDCGKVANALNITKNCNINLISLSVSIEEVDNEVTFFLSAGDLINATPPYTYQWFWDDTKVEIIGESTGATARFRPVGDAQIGLMVFPIYLQVSDAEGCGDVKQCWFTPTGMKCNANYDPCLPVEALSVAYEYVPCDNVKNLTVAKFNTEGRECMPLFSRDQFKIWRYDPDFNILTELFSYLGVNGSSPFVTRDIAMTNDRFWVYSGTHIYEYLMTLSPFSVVFNRQIAFPAGTGWDGAGLTAIDNDTLVGGDEDIIRFDISGGITDLTGHTTVLFSLPPNMVVTGDLIYDPVAEKYYILYYNLFNSNQSYLGVFSDVGVLLANIAMPVPTLTDDPPLGMYHYKNELFIVSLFGMVYSVDKTTLAITFVKAAPSNGSLGPRINGAAQPLNCTNL